MEKYSFVTRIPDQPGALHKAAEVITRHQGNINRIQFDRRIDPCTVFFELTASPAARESIARELMEMGYLQTALAPGSFLKLNVHIPNTPGALFRFLRYTTACRANIAYIDFDDRGNQPDRLIVSLNLEDSAGVSRLLDQLKSRFRMEVVEYDTTGKYLDDTVFYLRFAQSLRILLGESEDRFLLKLLGDANHIAQELSHLGQDARTTFESILETGETLRATSGDGFYAEVQTIPLGEGITLFCIQPPCGGNVFLLDAPEECVMIDTGYGIYHPDITRLIREKFPGAIDRLSRVVVTHADADHCGAGGHYGVPALMHPGTMDIIRAQNRAYGSRSEESVLEEVYTVLIALFSRFHPPDRIELLTEHTGTVREGFPVLGALRIGGHEFEVLEGMGGHLHGQIYLYSSSLGVLFSADTAINFGHLTPERSRYNNLAVILVTSVNVDSEKVRMERKGLFALARKTNGPFSGGRRECLICGGHGPVSVLEEKNLSPWGEMEHYSRTG